jgi:DUF4097 and DUF4098 domain-containing protein YvlB
VSLVPNPDGTVRITTTADGAAVSSGKLDVVDMDAGGELDTASGPISVKNVAGELSTSSVTGKTSLVQVFGSVDAQTIASDVSLDTVGGERLIASANRGSIAGRRVRARTVELTTTNGRIDLEGEAALRGRIAVSSLGGDVDVRLRHRR